MALVSWAISSSGKACRGLFYGLSWPRRRSYFLRSGFGYCCLVSGWRSCVSKMTSNCLTCSVTTRRSCCFPSTSCSKCCVCSTTIHCLRRLRSIASRSRRCVAKGLACVCPPLSLKDGVWCLLKATSSFRFFLFFPVSLFPFFHVSRAFRAFREERELSWMLTGAWLLAFVASSMNALSWLVCDRVSWFQPTLLPWCREE